MRGPDRRRRTRDGGGRPPSHGGAPLYISDYADNVVLRLPPGGTPATVAASGLTRPTGMALDPSGDLYIADTGNNRVVVVPGDGGPQTVVPATGLSRPIGLALNAEGDLYIADSFNDRVVKIPADGSGQVTAPTTGLLHPNGLALDRAGSLFVADFVNDRVVKVPADGGPQTTVPFTGLSQPTGLAFDRRGDLFVSDSGNDRVVRLPHGRRAAAHRPGDRAQLPVRPGLRPGGLAVHRGLQQRPGGEAAGARRAADAARRRPEHPGGTGCPVGAGRLLTPLHGAVTVRSPRRGEAKASRSARVRPVSRATSAVSSAPQSMPRSR